MTKYRPSRSRLLWRAVALAAGCALDRAFGDFNRYHPVAAYGRAAGKLEKTLYSDSTVRGAAFTTVAVGAPVLVSAVANKFAPHFSLAAAAFVSLGGTTLRRVGERMASSLDAGDIDAARDLVPWLCSRDPSALDAQGIARATVESLAENTSDAVTGTLFWGAVAGTPGVVAHRAINTLDAMVGYRNRRYNNFGWASAKLDDAAGYLPARLTAAATVVAGPDRRQALVAWRRDAKNHPSPNAGVVEASSAGALGVQLGGRTVYRSGVETRPVLGSGNAPTVADVRRCVDLSKRVQNTVALSCIAGVALAGLLARR